MVKPCGFLYSGKTGKTSADMKYLSEISAAQYIKKFFSNVLVFLECELNKPGADKKAIEHNISCMLMFRCNPEKFTRPEEIKLNELFVSPDGLGDKLFDIVKQMIIAVFIHYNIAPKGRFYAEKQIPQLHKKSKSIMMKNIPLYALNQIVFNKNLSRVYY